MNKIIYKDLENDPFQKSIIVELEKVYGFPLPEEVQTFLIDSAISSSMRVEQTRRWIQNTVAVINNILSKKAHDPEYLLFWILIYSIIFEYAPSEQKNKKFIELFAAQSKILKSLELLVSKLNDEEKILIKFYRHSNAHMHLNYIRYRADVKDGIIVKLFPPNDPRAIEIADSYMDKYNGDQKKIAYDFALKMFEPVTKLYENIISAINEK
jgi:hypothetical protein